ncbi:MAG: acetyl-CoA carboxylase biotin carboxylase subunit [Chloroflexi bacterium]|nr:acetyl-CoA carboxylase biotin carboxylase subunit [Chloroflexota bacterium]
MFRKILIANRGEIAVRIARACRELGVRAAVVYSEADRRALHVLQAEEAYCIGPAPVRESYLNIPALIDAARRAGAEALHPGYGFLSEDPALAEACQEAGIVFVGPPPEAMRLMGDKAAAKVAVERVGVPTVPGYHGEDDSLEALRREARRIGFPLLIKAAGGGGGRGMRIVRQAGELEAAVESARREARAAFGNGRLLLERLLERPRHVEVQVLGDRFGKLISLGERECSIQRRHQKVVEEAPSPAVDAALRQRLGEAAVRAARAAGYQNAGTVEFLLDQEGSFYFLEMNTRLQVEHPVTELATGLDLVKLQLALAAGEPLALDQEQLALRGHAIECRVDAEDPFHDHLPAAGRIERFEPPQGPGVRNDVGTYSGDQVSLHYDPLLAKLIVYAEDRAAAVARLEAALERYAVVGVPTNLPLLRRVAAHPEFRAGRLHTAFLDLAWQPQETPAPAPTEVLLAVAAFELGAGTEPSAPAGPWASGPWQPGRSGLPVRYVVDGRTERVIVAAPLARGEPWRIERRGERLEAAIEPAEPGRLLLRQGARVGTATVSRESGGWLVDWGGCQWRIERPTPPSLAAAASARSDGHAHRALSAPMPGKVVRVAVAEGERVAAHQLLVVLEAMKIEHPINAPFDGTIRRLLYPEGAVVDGGTLLVELEAK